MGWNKSTNNRRIIFLSKQNSEIERNSEKSRILFTTLQRLETTSSTCFERIQQTGIASRGIAFHQADRERAVAKERGKKKKRMSIWRGGKDVTNIKQRDALGKRRENAKTLVPLCICSEATRTVHTRLAVRKERKWSVRVTYFCISARLSTASGGCDGLQGFSERGWLVRRGGHPGFKSVSL